MAVEGPTESFPAARKLLARIRQVQGVVAVRGHLPGADGLRRPHGYNPLKTGTWRLAYTGPCALP